MLNESKISPVTVPTTSPTSTSPKIKEVTDDIDMAPKSEKNIQAEHLLTWLKKYIEGASKESEDMGLDYDGNSDNDKRLELI